MKIPLSVLSVLLLPVFVQAQSERVIEGGGAGTHKAVAATDLSGTFSGAFGGSYASVTLQWLEWRLKEKPWSRTVFTGEDCFCRYEGWGIAFKNEKTVM